MTLIEILAHYRAHIRTSGRAAANKFLHNICDKQLWWHIEHSVSDGGEFVRLGDNGEEMGFNPVTLENFY